MQNCPAGSVPVPAAGAGSCQLPAPQAPVTATSRGAARPSSPPPPAGPSLRGGACRGQRSLSSLSSLLFAVVGVPALTVVAIPAGGATSRALVGDAVVDLFFAAAVPAGGARRGHVCVGIVGVEILQRGTSRKHIR